MTPVGSRRYRASRRAPGPSLAGHRSCLKSLSSRRHGRSVVPVPRERTRATERDAASVIEVMRPVSIVAVCIAAALCACTSGNQRSASPLPSVAPAALTAEQMCRAAASETETVVAAHLTTVAQVRHRRGGPGNTSRADKPWAQLPADAPAAWCSFKTASRYVIAAATPAGDVVTFMFSKTMIDPGSEGPAIP